MFYAIVVTFNGDFKNKTLVFLGKLSPKRQGNILFLIFFLQNAKISPQKKFIAYNM
jgi:hypothetical protein